VVNPLQWSAAAGAEALDHSNNVVVGDFSQTSPVSRSRTAALFMFVSTMNRLFDGNV